MDSRFKQEVQKYGKKDAIIALCAYLVVAVLGSVFWFIRDGFEGTRIQFRMVQMIVPVIVAGMVLAIVFIKKQGLASIGIHKDGLWPAVRFGLVIALVLSAFGIVPGLIYGWEFHPFSTFMFFLLIAFALAAFEDIFFVGYLQTRLYGIFKKDVTAILTCALLFAIVHLPVGLIRPYLFGGLVSYMIILFISYVIMALIFRVHFSLIPIFILHTLSNFFANGDGWSTFNREYSQSYVGIALLLILLFLVIREIVNKRKQKSLAAK